MKAIDYHKLCEYIPFNADEYEMKEMFKYEIKNNESFFENTTLPSHATACAWIVDASFSKVLLMHHIVFRKWLPVGGHADGEKNLYNVAKREAFEETGLRKLTAFNEEIFSIDIHNIGASKSMPAHRHYDARFLFVGDIDEQLHPNHESKEMKWVDINAVCELSSDAAVHRMVEKSLLIRAKNG